LDLVHLRESLREEIHCFDASLPIERGLTPPASWYTDGRFFQLERDTTFRHHWLFAGRLDQVRQCGDFFTGSYLGRPYLVARNDSGQLNAFYNVCSHHGTRVVTGDGRGQTFVCPYHGWTYRLDGSLKSARGAGAIHCRSKRELGLQPLPLATWGPWILLHFGSPTEAIDRTFARLEGERDRLDLEGLTFLARVSYPIDCNWKVFVDNYLDGGYHVPVLHKNLSGDLDLAGYRSEIGDIYSLQTCPGTGADRLGKGAVYLWVHPNMMINRYGNWMDTNLVLPLTEDRCLVVFDYYYLGDPGEARLAEALASSAQVQQEDGHISLEVQAGLASGVYRRGVYAPRYEKPMHHFHQLLAADFGGVPAVTSV